MIEVPIAEPVITSIPNYAAHLALTGVYLQTNSKETYMNWFVQQFANVMCDLKEDRKGFLLFDNVFGGNLIHASPILRREIYNGVQMQNMGIPFKNFIIERLKAGFVVYMTLNRKFIPESQIQEDNNHETLIHGYDTETDSFFVSDFYHGKKYGTIKLSGENLEKCVSTFTQLNRLDLVAPGADQDVHIYTFQRFDDLENQKDLNIGYEPEKYLFALERYLNAKIVGNMAYGRKCYDIQEELICSNAADMKSFHLLYDHKVALQKSVEFLMDTKKIPYQKELIEDIKKLEKMLLIFRNLFIKEWISGKYRSDFLCKKLTEIKDFDEIVYTNLYDTVKKSC